MTLEELHTWGIDYKCQGKKPKKFMQLKSVWDGEATYLYVVWYCPGCGTFREEQYEGEE